MSEPGLSVLEENIARLERATEEAREAARDAHAARKDLEGALRDARALLAKEVKTAVDEAIGEAVKAGLDELGDSIRKATNDCYDRVGEQVDLLITLSLGKVGSVGKGHEDIRPALAAHLREWIKDQLDRVPSAGAKGEGRDGDG